MTGEEVRDLTIKVERRKRWSLLGEDVIYLHDVISEVRFNVAGAEDTRGDIEDLQRLVDEYASWACAPEGNWKLRAVQHDLKDEQKRLVDIANASKHMPEELKLAQVRVALSVLTNLVAPDPAPGGQSKRERDIDRIIRAFAWRV